MPKAKTHKALKKRFKLTANGKLLRKKQNRSHILTKKSSKRKRRLAKPTLVDDSFVNKFKRMRRGL